MNARAKRRIISDLKIMRKGISSRLIMAGPKEDDLFNWSATIIGPENTPWTRGIFRLFIFFNEQYPDRPPKLNFLRSEIFHSNIYKTGDVCIDILQEKWSPIFNTESILTSIQSILFDPNPLSPANSRASLLFRKSPLMYNSFLTISIELKNIPKRKNSIYKSRCMRYIHNKFRYNRK